MPRFPAVSASTDALSAQVFFAPIAARLATHPGPLHPLHVGDTWREPPAGARAEAQRSDAIPGLHRYSPIQGDPPLLDAIRARLLARTGRDVPIDTIQVVSGATSGLSVVVQALLDPGDEVLLPAPFWPLIRGIIASRGAVPVQIPLLDRLMLGQPVDVEAALEAAVTDRTAAIYVNSPHNPTGVVLDDDAVEAVRRVAARHGLWVLCDEVYEDLWYGDAPPTPIWARPGFEERAVAVHSLSKAYGLAGARVGYLHGPLAAVRTIRSVHAFQVYCSARPMQYGAAHALSPAGDAWLAETRALYRDAAAAGARTLGLPMPAGGTFLFFDASPWLPADADAATPFLLRCLDEGVVLTPGGSCGDAYARWVRVCYTTVAPDALTDALDGIQRAMEASP